jgi:hypothetical protein
MRNPRHQSEALPKAYAMISCRLGRSAKFFLVFREAGRSTPMMAADRSTRSFRVILFLTFMLGLPSLAAAATLEDSAKELAEKITAALPAQENVSCAIRNISTLRPDQVSRIEQALKAEFENRRVRLTEGGGSATTVVVTLSENLKNYIWTADIYQGDTRQIIFTMLPRHPQNGIPNSAMLMTLHGEKIWEGPERILDITFVSLSNGDERMLVLVPEGLIITKAEKDATFKKVAFPAAQSVGREPDGHLFTNKETVVSILDERECDVVMYFDSLLGCYPRPQLPGDDLIRMEFPGSDKPDHGDQGMPLSSICSIGDAMLVSGTGDYTQPDSIRVLEKKTTISNELDFVGPVLRFSGGSDPQFLTAVVHNLKDGNYEVYRLSISCGP